MIFFMKRRFEGHIMRCWNVILSIEYLGPHSTESASFEIFLNKNNASFGMFLNSISVASSNWTWKLLTLKLQLRIEYFYHCTWKLLSSQIISIKLPKFHLLHFEVRHTQHNQATESAMLPGISLNTTLLAGEFLIFLSLVTIQLQCKSCQNASVKILVHIQNQVHIGKRSVW